ncbi:hypothetical protein [Nocardia cyriacigeorgica]|uniref:hypothetical protein n=1 Tax=Nocardia cyriacigeorgica TaxID=135487 RepID=UPI001E3948BC|nr:hypothetical protein [Nocardia cyriacigeorgica]
MRPVPGMPIVTSVLAVAGVGIVTDVGEVFPVAGVPVPSIRWWALHGYAVTGSGGRLVLMGVPVLGVRHR